MITQNFDYLFIGDPVFCYHKLWRKNDIEDSEFKKVLVCWKMKMYTLIKNYFTSIFFVVADYDNLFHHLNSVQGNVELKCAFVRDVIREAGRFKKKVLIQMLEQFQTSLMQVEGRKRNSLPMETR